MNNDNSKLDIDTYFELMAKANGITINPEWHASIKSHLKVAEQMAAIVEAAPIDSNSLELASVFNPGEK